MNLLFIAVAAVSAAALLAAAQRRPLSVVDEAASNETVRQSLRAVVASSNLFSTDLYQVARAKPGNFVLSPLAAWAALALVWMGARGRTAQELGATLRLTGDRRAVAEGYGALLDVLQRNLGGQIPRLANKMYARRGSHPKDQFQQIATHYFQAEVEEVNFGDTENARLAINQWAKKATEGRINELFKEGSPEINTFLVLISTIYFKAGWSSVFDERSTTEKLFYASGNSPVNVPTMHGDFQTQYANIPELDAAVVRLPFKGRYSSMLILLPNDRNGLDYLENSLKNFNIDSIEYGRSEVNLSLPKFHIETTHLIDGYLKQMGVNDLFGEEANLRDIAEVDLVVSKVVQKTFIQVQENGTEAGAATGVDSRVRSRFHRSHFNVDHPFLFFVRDRDVTLFVGRVTNPAG